MERVLLRELKFATREQAVAFLKKLWNCEETSCPVCGSRLEILHRKAKKSACDWQCGKCGKVYKTIHLLDELNEQMPV